MHVSLYKQHFCEQRQAGIGKNQTYAKLYLEAELILFGNYLHFSSSLSSKNDILKNTCSKKHAK